LTYKLMDEVAGQGMVEVIAASINVFYTTIKHADNKEVYNAALLTLRDMVTDFEHIVNTRNMH
jgi:hypothetical protein